MEPAGKAMRVTIDDGLWLVVHGKGTYHGVQSLRHLREIKHLVIDMDGVLYRGNDPLPGLPEFFGFLREHGIGFRLATNNSGSTPQQYACKMQNMGAAVRPEEIITSGTATARWLAQRYPPGTRVHVFGENSLRTAMTEAGFELADEHVAAVVASIDWGVTYDKIKRACLLIRGGAQFVATNLDPTRPTEEGLVPGTGALIAAIATGAETQPVAIGKPEPTMFEQAMAEMGAQPETTATLGDRIDSDMVGGVRAGLRTILVLSGSTGRAEAENYGPDLIFEDIAALTQAWRAALAPSLGRGLAPGSRNGQQEG